MTTYVELIALPSKSSAYVARTFLEQILSRFGVPGFVLTDQGTEFQGEFQNLLTQQNITHWIAAKENPQADGLAERMVQALKRSLIRCLLDQIWGVPWDESLFLTLWETTIFFFLPSTIQHLEEEDNHDDPTK